MPQLTQLDRYLFRQTGLPFVLILLCTTAVVWLTQVLQRVDLMVEDGGSLAAFLQVTVLLVPSLVGVIIPFAVLGAVLFGLNQLAVDNELPVIGAAGGSRLRIARPVMALGVLASLGVLLVNLDLQPRSYRALKDTVQTVRSDIARSLIRSGVFTEVMEGVTIYADEVRPGDQYIGLLINDARDPLKNMTYTAESALFTITEAGPRLLLARGTGQERNLEEGTIAIYQFIETAVNLATFEGGSDGRRKLESTERYVGELFAPDAQDEFTQPERRALRAEGHARLATPLYAFAFAVMAAAALLTAPVARRGYTRRLLLAIGAAILLRTLGFVAQSAAGDLAPLNALQYLVPVTGAGVALVMITGRFWAVRQRRADLGAFLPDAAQGAPA